MIRSRAAVLYDEVIRYLKEKEAEYIDKTSKGGSLYFFDDQIANEMKEAGYEIYYAANGTKGTERRAAWYISFK